MKITGIVEQETIKRRGQSLMRESTVKASLQNAITYLQETLNIRTDQYKIHLNFPGGMPVDGPSAGIAIFIALYSAINRIPVPNNIAFTGEISIFGNILPVGGVFEKISAAKDAGASKVFIPKANDKSFFHRKGIAVYAVDSILDVLSAVFKTDSSNNAGNTFSVADNNILTAESASDRCENAVV